MEVDARVDEQCNGTEALGHQDQARTGGRMADAALAPSFSYIAGKGDSQLTPHPEGFLRTPSVLTPDISSTCAITSRLVCVLVHSSQESKFLMVSFSHFNDESMLSSNRSPSLGKAQASMFSRNQFFFNSANMMLHLYSIAPIICFKVKPILTFTKQKFQHMLVDGLVPSWVTVRHKLLFSEQHC
eukprot:1145181-Pelagomonas_calceolata.AAC.5